MGRSHVDLIIASGRLAVYTASARYGEAYICDVVVGEGPLVP